MIYSLVLPVSEVPLPLYAHQHVSSVVSSLSFLVREGTFVTIKSMLDYTADIKTLVIALI